MRQCVILVGGKGSRLGELTKYFPKPMLEINEQPFLIYLIDTIERFGFKEIILLASHANKVLIDYFKDLEYKECKIKIIIEEAPLGTGGAIVNAYDYLDDTFFCINGDSVIEGNWLSLKPILKKNYDAVIALTEVNNSSRYGSIEISGDRIIEFNEKNKHSDSGLINGGIYILRKKIFKNYKNKFISLEKDIFPNLLLNNQLGGKKVIGYFIDIGTPESLSKAKKRIWSKNKKAVIFDRDGTLSEDINGYTYKVSDLVWKPGAKDLIKNLNDNNFYVFVATNQSGIARGKYTEDEMHDFHDAMQIDLMNHGAHIDKFYFCPYHKDAINLHYKKDSICRKPNTGMLEKIKEEWNLDKINLHFIGDSDIDMECARNFKISGYKYNGTDNLMKIYDNVFVNY